MFQNPEILTKFWLAQITLEPSLNTERATPLIFSGSQFFSSLIAGVVLAFAFQLLFANLGIAAWISTQGRSHSTSDRDRESASFGSTIRQVSVKLGLATLVSVTLALFLACTLAVRLGLFVSPVSGAIVGLTIWATFSSLLVWLSSNRLGSLISSIANAATSGLQAILGTATAAIGSKAASKQAVATAEAAAAAVGRGLGKAIDPKSLRRELEGYLGKVKSPELDTDKIAADFEKLLERENLSEIGNRLPQFDRQTFRNLIGNRSDLSQKDLDRIANRLETIWQQKLDRQPKSQDRIADFKNYLQSATREQLLGKDFGDRLDTLIQEMRQNRSSKDPTPVSGALTLGVNSLVGLMMGRSDLSKFDIDKIVAQIQQLKEHLGEQTDKIATGVGISDSQSSLKKEIENYLFNIYPWQIGQENLHREFRDLLYNPEDDPEKVAVDLRQIDRSYFAKLLKQKDIYTQTKIESISQLLEGIRLGVLTEVETAIEQKKAIAVLTKMEDYLLDTPKENLTPAEIQLKFSSIFLDSELDYEQLSEHLARFDRSASEKIFAKRKNISASETSNLIAELEIAKERVLQQAQEEQASAQMKAEVQWQRVQSYLREASKEELTSQAMQKELKSVLGDRHIDGIARKVRKNCFDRHILAISLTQRQDLSQKQIDRILKEVETFWIPNEPSKLITQAQDRYEQAKSSIADYLRSSDKEELNPEGIKRDIQLLLNHPRAGMGNLQERLSHFDRDTLVALFSQRDDISQEDVNRIIDQILAIREQMLEQLQTVQTTLDRVLAKVQDYFSRLPLPQLDYERIKNDLHNLFDDPKAGFESLRDRFSHFDRDTLINILSSRDDISKADAERIISQVETTRDRLLRRAERIQQEAKLRVEEVKKQAQRQAEETRQAAAIASWWLFFTAFISAIASASAGALGVVD